MSISVCAVYTMALLYLHVTRVLATMLDYGKEEFQCSVFHVFYLNFRHVCSHRQKQFTMPNMLNTHYFHTFAVAILLSRRLTLGSVTSMLLYLLAS
jgi:hypothetical protein